MAALIGLHPHQTHMIYYLLMRFLGLVLDLFAAIQTAPDEKDLQIALLRQQLRILERKSRA